MRSSEIDIKRIPPGAVVCERFSRDIGNIHIRQIMFRFRNDKFVAVLGYFGSDDFDALKDIFIRAYGKPHRVSHEVMRTVGGGEFDAETLRWEGGQATINVYKYGSKITEGYFKVVLTSEMGEELRIDQAARKRAADSLK